MGRRELSARIKDLALAAGFTRAGIATLAPSATSGANDRWLGEGGHAGMGYLERHAALRQDPRHLLPAARSVLCVALDYAPPANEPKPDGDFWPGVARYARGDDYHDSMREKLGKVKDSIEAEVPGVEARVCVDTAPLLEREWAARAGLGSFGKNTNLLNPVAGSFFLLAELLLSLDLTPDLPLADLCGSCTRCLDACPTGALSPYRLESSRCISYWTIENRGDIPPAVRAAMGEWVFGCDICQEVCPWNGDPLGELASEFAIPEARQGLSLVGVLGGEEGDLRSALRGTPLLRPKVDGLKRNVAVAMGNRRDPGYIASLAEALESGSPLVRRHSAWALGKIGTAEAKEILQRARESEADPDQRRELEEALRPL
ncbi:MAG: tRNA epoxyqueuosine(34) reductase QueG [Thermoanaerobaculia bacterium]